jgi:hypothetical protein
MNAFIVFIILFASPFFLCYIINMTIEQTVEIPADHRLVIDVPPEVPAGKATITFAPAMSETEVEECPICAAHRDPVTGEEQFNAKTAASLRESMAMARGEIPSTLRGFKTVEEMWEDLDRDDPDDDLDDE